jgi:hypothetical protein
MLSQQRTRQLIATGVGLVIVFVFVAGLIGPFTNNDTNDNTNTNDFEPTSTPRPALPDPDLNPQLTGEAPRIQRSGYFQSFWPAGSDWQVSDEPIEIDPETGTLTVGLVLNSTLAGAVIHTFMSQGNYDSIDSLNTKLDLTYYSGVWGPTATTDGYDSWEPTANRVEGDTIITDFDLVSNGLPYLGRDITRLTPGWLYITRLVVPENNPALLDLLQQLVIPSFIGFTELQQLPAEWPIYADQQLGFVLKYPETGWEVAVGNEGQPATLNFTADTYDGRVRLWAVPNQPITTPEEASAWLMSEDSHAAILGTEVITRERGTGFLVSYTTQDTDNRYSGLAALINDASGTLYVAILWVKDPDINLLDLENLPPALLDVHTAVTQGFIILPPESRIVSETAPAATEEPAPVVTEDADGTPAAE